MMALEVALVILVVQQLEGTLISPKLMGGQCRFTSPLGYLCLLAGEGWQDFGEYFLCPDCGSDQGYLPPYYIIDL